MTTPSEHGDPLPVSTTRRRLIAAGALGALGVGAGLAWRYLRPGDDPAGGAGRPAPSGIADPSIGEYGRPGEAGYRSRGGAALRAVPTSCLQCVAICGTIAYVDGDRVVKIEGNPHSPNNRGMICAKGQAGPNQVYDPDRLLHPLVRVGKRGEGKWRRISMAAALDLVVSGGEIAGRQRKGLKAIYEGDHPERFMFHYGRSRIKAAVNHFVSSGFGSKTIGNHTSICETAKWLGNELTMGKHYDINDVERSKFVVIMGANVLEAHTSHSYFAQRLVEARARGTRVVTFDVRLSNTAAATDEWIPVRPGTDLAVVLAMTHVILEAKLYDAAFIERWTNVGVADLRAHYGQYTPEWAAAESGVPAETIRRIGLEYGRNRPSTLITYRGFVGHYNGTYAEWAAKVLDGLCGNMMVAGGTQVKVSGKCKDSYAAVAKKHPEHVRKPRKLKILDGDGVHLPTHHVCQGIYESIMRQPDQRPELYMTYCYNGAYTTGDCARNLQVLGDEEALPFIVAVDVAMSETTAMADLILPDATYLERWTLETPQSYALEPFIQLRQPAVPPRGETMDMQDIFIQLARRIGGGLAALHPFDTAEEMIAASVRAQEADQTEHGKSFYDVAGAPLAGDAWEYLKQHGVLRQATAPRFETHESALSASALAGGTVDTETGVVWDPAKAGLSAAAAKTASYRRTKNAYKGYLGQCLGRDGSGAWDRTTARTGFKPDKINKSGLFEVSSTFMAEVADPVLADVEPVLTAAERPWFAEHLRSGLPCWVPVPEHRRAGEGSLVLTSFKVNVQIHSRSQNCKWLQELYHKNPAWIHPATARERLGADVRDNALIEISQAMPALGGQAPDGEITATDKITARIHLTEAIQPGVIALSFHCGHWEYGRYASGRPLAAELTGSEPDKERAWWQSGVPEPGRATGWSQLRGVHPNWIIPNTPARVSGQFRSNDTLVRIRAV